MPMTCYGCDRKFSCFDLRYCVVKLKGLGPSLVLRCMSCENAEIARREEELRDGAQHA